MSAILHFGLKFSLIFGGFLYTSTNGNFTGSPLEYGALVSIILASFILDLWLFWRKRPKVLGPGEGTDQIRVKRNNNATLGKVASGILMGLVTGAAIVMIFALPKPTVIREVEVEPPLPPRPDTSSITEEISVVGYNINNGVLSIDLNTDAYLQNPDVFVYVDGELVLLDDQYVSGGVISSDQICLDIVIDISGSMTGKLNIAKTAASSLVGNLRETDLVRVIPYDDYVYPGNWISPNEAATEISYITLGGNTATWDAIAVSQQFIPCGAHHTVILTDGNDTASVTSTMQSAASSVFGPLTIVGIESEQFNQDAITEFINLCNTNNIDPCQHISADIGGLVAAFEALANDLLVTRITVFIGALEPSEVRIVIGLDDYHETIFP